MDRCQKFFILRNRTAQCDGESIPGTTLCKGCTRRLKAEKDQPYAERCSGIITIDEKKGVCCPRRASAYDPLCLSCRNRN